DGDDLQLVGHSVLPGAPAKLECVHLAVVLALSIAPQEKHAADRKGGNQRGEMVCRVLMPECPMVDCAVNCPSRERHVERFFQPVHLLQLLFPYAGRSGRPLPTAMRTCLLMASSCITSSLAFWRRPRASWNSSFSSICAARIIKIWMC